MGLRPRRPKENCYVSLKTLSASYTDRDEHDYAADGRLSQPTGGRRTVDAPHLQFRDDKYRREAGTVEPLPRRCDDDRQYRFALRQYSAVCQSAKTISTVQAAGAADSGLSGQQFRSSGARA